MDKYSVQLMPRARRDLEGIYAYIANTLLERGTAEDTIDALEAALFSLEELPRRCAERKRGIYADRGYRQLFIKNYTIVFRIDEERKRVIVVTVRYSRSNF